MSQKDQLEDQIQTMLDKVLDDDKDDDDFINYFDEELPSFLDENQKRTTDYFSDFNSAKKSMERPKTAGRGVQNIRQDNCLFEDYQLNNNNNMLLSTSLSNNSNLR
jgi:hypothetical protein